MKKYTVCREHTKLGIKTWYDIYITNEIVRIVNKSTGKRIPLNSDTAKKLKRMIP
jgi:hypothetical protein